VLYYQEFQDVGDEIYYEKKLKKWRRKWKLDLIGTNNPEWRDLFFDFFDPLDFG